MQKNRFKEKIIEKLKSDLDYGLQSVEDKLLNEIKSIDNFCFSIEVSDFVGDIKDDEIVINNMSAFEKGEIEEFNNLSINFKNKLKELNFIVTAYLTQQKYAREKFDLPMTIKIKKSLDDVLNKLDFEKSSIRGINNEINSKEKAYAEKMTNFSNILKDMKNDDCVDEKKLIVMFGEKFINNYRMGLIGTVLDNLLNKCNINKLISNDELKKLMIKYHYKM